MKFSNIVLESKADDFRTKYKQRFTKEQIEKIIELVPTKFLEWVGKNIDPVNFDQDFNDAVQNLKLFEKYSTNLALTDINSYKSIQELKNTLTQYVSKPRREYKEVAGGNVVYDDGRYFVVNPLTHQSSCYYGKGTKWCTASELPGRFEEYNTEGKLFYILDRSLPTSDDNYKVAILMKFDGSNSYWDAKDVQKDTNWFPKLNLKSKEILDSINEYLENNYSEQLKIYRDKETAKKERQRVEQLRIRRQILAFEGQAEERRLEGEWDLTNPNIDEDGISAHGVLNYIDEFNDYKILNDEDKSRIEQIKTQIETLTNEYNESDEVRGDILDQIQELEEELELFSDGIDVYSLIPDGTHYGLTRFVLASDPYGSSWAAGYEDDVQTAAEQYVENLIDDVGYDGFREGFLENYLDESYIESTIREMEYYGVHDSPESYIDESKRELSRKQEEKLEVLRRNKLFYETKINELNEKLLEIEDEQMIESLESTIENIEIQIEEYDDEITDIEDSPEGDFPEELIDRVVDDLVADRMRNPIDTLKEMGWDIADYVDKEKFIEGVVEEDGYGVLSSWDGSYEYYKVLDKYVYVFRVD